MSERSERATDAAEPLDRAAPVDAVDATFVGCSGSWWPVRFLRWSVMTDEGMLERIAARRAELDLLEEAARTLKIGRSTAYEALAQR
ncbi:hypothetical protein [Microbispora sp. KK1-11]|uniref:hypothetical protein n=1 Tax=Microbispora sp. KK1-11 TaxID=2053005 RepID=UPI00163D10F5|nr:hypothetical protein [Microbispora sp. KK1-11]